jgi:predicted DsbA family dithiol-disulfide isomerase
VKELKRRMPEVEITWRAFELRPEPAARLDPKGEYLTRVWSQSVYPLAEKIGVKMSLPPVQPRSRLAHEAATWARAQGRFDDMNETIFRALFERGEDIASVDVLARLASSVELDGEALKVALDRHEFLEQVIADERRAAAYGLSGVPAFIAGGAVLFGVQSADTLEEFARLAARAGEGERREGPLPHLPVKLQR